MNNNYHIYEIPEMEDYLPKKMYCGNAGKIQSFLDSMTDFLFPEADSPYFKNKQRNNMLQLLNAARNITLSNLKQNLVINKMNWYVKKIFELISENQCNYDGYCLFLEANVCFDTNKLEIEVTDCEDKIFGRKCEFDYLSYVNEPNYLKRNYSDKLLAYTCNLLELYHKYFEKDTSDYIGLNISMNGDKCFGGRGFIEWK